jgi:predicted lipase
MESQDWKFLLDMACASELAYWPLKKISKHWFVKQGAQRIKRGRHKDDLVRAQVVSLLCRSDRIPRRTEEKSMDAVMVSVDYAGTLVLAFRGTETLENLITDTKTDLGAINTNVATGVYVHRGFQMHHRTLMNAVIHEITRYVHGGGKEVVFTGHSLGASVCLMSAFACAIDPVLSMFMQHVGVRCVTFGCPRVGARDFTEWSNELVPGTIKVVNSGDIVTMFPRHMHHVGKMVEIADAKSLPCLACHKLENYVLALRKKLPGISIAQVDDHACRSTP